MDSSLRYAVSSMRRAIDERGGIMSTLVSQAHRDNIEQLADGTGDAEYLALLLGRPAPADLARFCAAYFSRCEWTTVFRSNSAVSNKLLIIT